MILRITAIAPVDVHAGVLGRPPRLQPTTSNLELPSTRDGECVLTALFVY
ncbi:hypothetical protein RRSWK_03959 [Rhodopirellula sp. SWK7]|nr:hypothetical protein RRSWK_03959 [Rhodopirellula sp. SWK7]